VHLFLVDDCHDDGRGSADKQRFITSASDIHANPDRNVLLVYFLFNLQNVWNLLARLPAVFPDGIPLERKSSPWLLTDLVSFYFRHLRANLTPLSYAQRILSVLLAWYLVPVTLLAFWFRYLPARDLIGTVWQTSIIILSFFFATSLHGLANSKLRMEVGPHDNQPSERTRAVLSKKRAARIFATAALAAVLLFFANGVIYGTWHSDRELLTTPLRAALNSSFVPWVCAHLRIGHFVRPNLAHLDVSTKPTAWNGKDEGLDSIKGGNLSSRDISFADCNGTFAANARFVDTNLSGAQFSYSDLRKSDLTRAFGRETGFAHAQLARVSFGASKMPEAQFYGAHLNETIFTSDFLRARLGEHNKSRSLLGFSSSDFSRGDFSYAEMTKCDCRSTIFARARFLVARLRDVDFTGSDLRMVYFTGASISNCDFELAKLSGSSFDGATLNCVKFNNANFSDRDSKLRTVFSNANLHNVDFSSVPDIRSGVFSGAHFDKSTRWPEGFDPTHAGGTLEQRDF